jgi:hypothetical protein
MYVLKDRQPTRAWKLRTTWGLPYGYELEKRVTPPGGGPKKNAEEP